MTRKTVPAGQFKQGCLALLDEVASENVEIVVTKRGRPVARLVAVGDPGQNEATTLARLRGRVTRSVGRDADLLTPTSTLTNWKSLSRSGKR